MISEEEYKRTLIRIWNSVRRYTHRGELNCKGGECWLCPLEKVCNPAQKPRVELFRVFEAINIVEKWGKEHHVVTNRGKFKEVFGVEVPDYSETGFWDKEYTPPKAESEDKE